MGKYTKRKADAVLPAAAEIEARSDHVVLIVPVVPEVKASRLSTVGIRFISPDHLLAVFFELLQKAAQVWPDHPIIKYYRETMAQQPPNHTVH